MSLELLNMRKGIKLMRHKNEKKTTKNKQSNAVYKYSNIWLQLDGRDREQC